MITTAVTLAATKRMVTTAPTMAAVELPEGGGDVGEGDEVGEGTGRWVVCMTARKRGCHVEHVYICTALTS